MKKLFFILSLFFCLYIQGQTIDANIVIDWSEVSICNMDEEAYASIEADWFKDKPDITQNLLKSLQESIDDIISFRKSSTNTLQLSVISIDKSGLFVCKAELIDKDKNSILLVQNNNDNKLGGMVYQTSLRRMKLGATTVGRDIGKLLKKQYKKMKKNKK